MCESLATVPTEIVRRICRSLARNDLAHLARTSSRFFHIAVPYIWKELFLDARNLLALLPNVTTVDDSGKVILNPKSPSISDPDVFFSRFSYYSQSVLAVELKLTKTSDSLDETHEINTLSFLLSHTLTQNYFPKLQALLIVVDVPADTSGRGLVGLSWAGLFLSNSLNSLTVSFENRSDAVFEAANGLIKRILQGAATLCPKLSSLEIPSTSLISCSNRLSSYKELRVLSLSGSFTATQSPTLFTTAEFEPDAFINLQRLAIDSHSVEIVLDLWASPIVTHINEASIRVWPFSNEDGARLFSLISSHSPKITSLSAPLSPNTFSHQLLEHLSQLSLRKLALTMNLEMPMLEFHSSFFQYVGSLWPKLEFLMAHVLVTFGDFLNIHMHLPHLRHLSVICPFEGIDTYEIPHTSWDSPPEHPLILWTSLDWESLHREENKQRMLVKFLELLATTWPYMEMFVVADTRYMQMLQAFINAYSSRIVKEKRVSENISSGTPLGMIHAKDLTAYISTPDGQLIFYR